MSKPEAKQPEVPQIPEQPQVQQPGITVHGTGDAVITPARAKAIMSFMQRVGNMEATEIPAWADCMAVLAFYANEQATEGEDNGDNSVS